MLQERGSKNGGPVSQQSLRLYPEDRAIIEEWAAVLSPMMPTDRSAIIRQVLRMTRHCIADVREGKLR